LKHKTYNVRYIVLITKLHFHLCSIQYLVYLYSYVGPPPLPLINVIDVCHVMVLQAIFWLENHGDGVE
jgi:hypothetical protein